MHICVPLIVIEEGRKLEINMWLLFPQPSCFLRDVLDKMHRARFLPYDFYRIISARYRHILTAILVALHGS